jgi:hypothetical protein
MVQELMVEKVNHLVRHADHLFNLVNPACVRSMSRKGNVQNRGIDQLQAQ